MRGGHPGVPGQGHPEGPGGPAGGPLSERRGILGAIENQQVVEVPQAGAAQPAVPAKKKLSPVLIGGVAAAVVVVLGIGMLSAGTPAVPEGRQAAGTPSQRPWPPR